MPWVCGALETAKKLGHKSAGEALALLEAALSEAGEPGPREQVKREIVRKTEPLAEHRRPTKEEARDKGANSTFKRGSTNAQYLTARLKRDAPDIADRLERGGDKTGGQGAYGALKRGQNNAQYLTARLKREIVRKTAPLPEPKPGERTDLKPRSDRTRSESRGETAQYLTARLKRDAPDIANRLERGGIGGRFRSAAEQAAKAAARKERAAEKRRAKAAASK